MKKTSILQLISITATIVAVILLYSIGRTVPNSVKSDAQNNNSTSINVDSDQIENSYLSKLSDDERQRFNELDQKNYQDIANYFKSIDQYQLASIFATKFATENESLEAWNLSGDFAVRSFRETNDSTQSRYFLNEAVSSYQNSIKAKATIDTKMKLALLYTQLTGEIMPGVALLREILEEEPTHIQANYELALLSIQSGQDDKAIERFNSIIAIDPDFIEAYIYKAQLLLKNNKKPEALETLDLAINRTKNEEGLKVLKELRKNIENN